MTGKIRIGFPLLAKELTELANRRRTYIVRFVYAAGLFIGGLTAIYGTVGAFGGDVRLGVGRELFHDLVQMQFWLILIFLPPAASGALTVEKERDSFALLLLTTMPPWSILLQKYLSRLLPMVSFLLLSFPLLAVGYSYGGVDTGEMIGSVVLLLLFAAEVSAVAIMCSAYCRTTSEALIASYVVLFGLSITWAMWPPSLFAYVRMSPQNLSGVLLTGLVMAGGGTVCLLLLARVFLQKRAFVPPRNVLLQAFQRLDRLYERMNHLTGGVVLVNDSATLPEEEPVAWRETAKKSLGTFRYLFRVCTVLELPILFAGTAINITTVRTNSAMSALLYLLWGIAAALICVHASGIITAERSRQTLDVLLTTPLTGADILRQKMAGVRRLISVLWVPFGSIFAFQLWFRGFDFGYFIGSIASAAILLPLMAWMALAVGLRIRSAIKAILTSVGIVVGTCVLPFLLSRFLIADVGQVVDPIASALEALSPVTLVMLLERRGVLHDQTSELTFWLGLLSLPLLACAWWWVRRDCLRRADLLLQRVPDSGTDDEAEPAASNTPSTEDVFFRVVEAV